MGWLNFDLMAIPGAVHDYPMIPKHFYDVEGVDVSHQPVELNVPYWDLGALLQTA